MENEVLTVSFCSNGNSEAGLTVFKELGNDHVCTIKM